MLHSFTAHADFDFIEVVLSEFDRPLDQIDAPFGRAVIHTRRPALATPQSQVMAKAGINVAGGDLAGAHGLDDGGGTALAVAADRAHWKNLRAAVVPALFVKAPQCVCHAEGFKGRGNHILTNGRHDKVCLKALNGLWLHRRRRGGRASKAADHLRLHHERRCRCRHASTSMETGA